MSKLNALIKNIDWSKVVPVLVVAFIVAVLTVLHVLIGFAKTPTGTVYMWTGHYFLDYFEYVQSISQGTWGRWFANNPFTTDYPSEILFWRWQYLIFGKIGKIFHLSSIGTYWLSNVLLSFVLSLLIFKAIEKLLANESFKIQFSAFLLTLFATPLFKFVKDASGLKASIFGFWNDKAVFFDRFEPVPYHLSATILALAVLLLCHFPENTNMQALSLTLIKRMILVVVIMLFLLTFSPSSVLLLLATLGLSFTVLAIKSLIKKKKIVFIYS